jgi:hypothetical protein
MQGRLPDFVIIGAIRSGTTSMARYLGAHPQIYMADQKEVRFFNSNLDKGLEWYAMQFHKALPDQIAGEATPAYMSNSDAMKNMADLLPDARLIAVVREPASRAWSHYWMRRERRRETRTFSQAIDQEKAAIARDGPDSPGLHYLNNSMYAYQLRRAIDLFSRNNLLVVIFERMLSDAPSEYRAACDFLGVPASFVPDIVGSPINPYVGFRSLRLRDASRRLPGPLRRVVGRLNTRTSVSYPKIDEASRRALVEFFAPHNQDLEELLSQPVPEWAG